MGTEGQFERQIKYIGCAPLGIRPLCVQSLPFARRPILRSLRTKSASIICAAVLVSPLLLNFRLPGFKFALSSATFPIVLMLETLRNY